QVSLSLSDLSVRHFLVFKSKKSNHYKQFNKERCNMALFTADTLRKSFTNGEVEEQVLKGISLSMNKGEITALDGASCSGKSTLLTIADCLQQTSNGTIIFNGQDMTAMSQENIRIIRASEFRFVFKSSHLVPFLTVEEQLMLM